MIIKGNIGHKTVALKATALIVTLHDLLNSICFTGNKESLNYLRLNLNANI